jgi:hypothetical protein
VATVDEVAAWRPESIRRLLDIQLDRFAANEQRILEAASVVGPAFVRVSSRQRSRWTRTTCTRHASRSRATDKSSAF